MKTFFAVALSVCFFAVVGRAAPAAGGRQEFILLNKTGLDFSEVYVAPAGSNDWDVDVLGDSSLDNDEEATIHFQRNETAAKWDVRIIDENGEAVVWKDINLLTLKKITLFYKNKKPTAETE